MKPGDTLTINGLAITVTGLPHPDATSHFSAIDEHGQARFFRWGRGVWTEFWPPAEGVWTWAHGVARRIVREVLEGEAA